MTNYNDTFDALVSSALAAQLAPEVGRAATDHDKAEDDVVTAENELRDAQGAVTAAQHKLARAKDNERAAFSEWATLRRFQRKLANETTPSDSEVTP